MIDYKILNEYGTTNAALRKIFTAKDGRTRYGRAKKMLVDAIASHIQEGISWNLKNSHFYGAADLMWDSTPILPENIPLILFAQKKLNVKETINQLEKLNCADKFLTEKETEEGTLKELDLGKFVEVAVNIGRSYISRRVFAQTNRFSSMHPYLPYESRRQTMVGKLRAALASERMDIMTSQYGYRHVLNQAIRDTMIYSHSTVFPECAWHDERQMISEDGQVMTRIEREGVPFSVEHPTKVIYDRSYPLSSINTDLGCEWIGFWTIKRYKSIRKNPDFFNKDRVKFSSTHPGLISEHENYFSMIYASDPINLRPSTKKIREMGIANANDAKINGLFYSQVDDEQSVFLTDLRIKVIPNEIGTDDHKPFGTYPYPIWVRVLVASDDTVVYAEILPSRPAFNISFNVKDDRLLNMSQMHELMPWQDQLSNIFSQLLLSMKHNLLRIFILNKDILHGEEMNAFKEGLKGDRYYMYPHLLEISFSDQEELRIDIDKVIKIINTDSGTHDYISTAFKAMMQILAITERLLMLSPQELGQPARLEISATEAAAIEGTTTTVYSAFSDSIEEGRAAWKRILFESWQAKGEKTFELPVSSTFLRKTVEDAGLTVVNEFTGETVNRGETVTGSKSSLIHDIEFTSRDADRPTNQMAANTLATIISQVLPIIGPENINKDKVFAITNEIFRLAGSAHLSLTREDGESNSLGAGEQIEQIMMALQNLSQAVGTNSSEIEELQSGLLEVINQIRPS